MTIEIEINKESIKIDPYRCPVKAIVRYPAKLATVGHIPWEISRRVYFSPKEEGGKVESFVFSIKYRASPILAGGLEIPLTLSFKKSSILNIAENQEVSCPTLLLRL